MKRYRLNSPDVIQETVEGEALVIHTPSGVYYSLESTAEHVWNALLAGHTAAEIVSAYAVEEDAHSALIEAVEDFAQNLEDEQLLVPRDQTTAPGVMSPAPQPFSKPVYVKFTDMQELLLVDPIHEVDPQVGWPPRRDPE